MKQSWLARLWADIGPIWTLFVFATTLFFLPPISLPFMRTRSGMSAAVLIASFYLLITFVVGRTKLPVPRTWSDWSFYGLCSYVFMHGCVMLAAAKIPVALMEFQWTVYLLAPALMFIAARRHVREVCLSRILQLIGVVAAIFGIVSAFNGPIVPDFTGYADSRIGLVPYRAVGMAGSANGFGGVMMSFVVLAAFMPRRYLVAPRTALLLIFSLALAATESRSAITSSIVTILLLGGSLLFWRLFSKAGAKIGHLFISAIFCVFVILLLIFAGSSIQKNYSQDLFGDQDSHGRLSVAAAAVDRYVHSGLVAQLTGIGFRQSASFDPDIKAYVTAHNSYVSLLVEIGLIGSGLFVCLLLTTAAGLARNHAWPWLAVLIANSFHNLTECFFYGGVPMLLVALCYAIARPAVVTGRDAARPVPRNRVGAFRLSASSAYRYSRPLS
jgi:hypothetical protein